MADGKVHYKTKHKEELEEYLSTIPGEHFTASDVCDHFKKIGRPMGTTTVYRQLERLVGDGRVNKYIIDENSSACFEYIGAERDCYARGCFHCKCEKCGMLIHMECHELSLIKDHLMEEHGFVLDPLRTVFYGICEKCKSKED